MMTRIFTVLCLLLVTAAAVSLFISRPLFDEPLNRSTLSQLDIAPTREALTFARFRSDGQLQVMLVTQYANDQVTGVNLNRRLATPEADPIQLFRKFGYEAITLTVQATIQPHEVAVIAANSLELPFEAREQNIGIGANYREHARESGIEEQPFVFPKIAQPTHALSTVAQQLSTLLDYEAELGLVALDDITAGETKPKFGLVLCNELTDRWPLVQHLRREEPMGKTGFAEGKSREGFAPIGSLLVIPRELDAFYRQLELRLYVNGRLRQKESAGNMVWGPSEILRQIFRRADWRFPYYEQTLNLLGPESKIRAGTIIFSGTPAGVIFKPVNLWNRWLYLQPGDEVTIRSDSLGIIQNRIVE